MYRRYADPDAVISNRLRYKRLFPFMQRIIEADRTEQARQAAWFGF